LRKEERSAEYMETIFHFKVGDLVLRRRKIMGKIKAKADGPYKVVKVGGSFLQRITIEPLVQIVGKRKQYGR
jgi:hypothetical protein